MNNEQLMVMRNKIENVGLEDCGVDGGLVGEIIDELIDSRYKIESISAERDEAREEVQRLTDCLKKANSQTEEMERNWYLEQNKTESLTEELTALRSAPGMEDVESCFNNYHGNSPQDQMCDVPRLESVARQAIVSRDEVVGLLKFAVSSDLLWIIRRQLAGKGNWSEETKQKGRRILEIVEGK